MSTYIQTISFGPKSKIPKCTSFVVVSKAVNDPTTVSKLHVFVKVAKIFEPYLKSFQKDIPMIPFIEEELGKVLKSIMECFIKPSVILSKRYMSD